MYIGIDLHKKYSVYTSMDVNGNIIKQKRVEHDSKDLDEFVSSLDEEDNIELNDKKRELEKRWEELKEMRSKQDLIKELEELSEKLQKEELIDKLEKLKEQGKQEKRSCYLVKLLWRQVVFQLFCVRNFLLKSELRQPSTKKT